MLINKDDWLDLKLRLWSNSLGQSWKERSLWQSVPEQLVGVWNDMIGSV